MNYIEDKKRIYFLDNLRSFLIFLVVMYHSGIVYESSGIAAYFWIVDDPATNDLVGILNLTIDIFVMSAIFFISGFFAPLSLEKKDGKQFLKSKFKRLILPWLISVVTLIPIYKVIFLYSRNLAQENWMTYFHFNNGIFSQSWLWFLPVLFLFELTVLFLSKLNFDLRKISFRKAVVLAFLLGFMYSFLIAIFKGHGWTKTVVLDFQNERLFIYLIIFLLGALSNKLKIFDNEQKTKTLYTILNWTSWFPVSVYLFMVIYSFLKPEEFFFSELMDQFIKRLFFHISLFSLLYTLIIAFRKNFNKRSRISTVLSKNSYGVYIVHVVVLGGIALLMLDSSFPSLVKYSILTAGTYLISNLIVSLYKELV